MGWYVTHSLTEFDITGGVTSTDIVAALALIVYALPGEVELQEYRWWPSRAEGPRETGEDGNAIAGGWAGANIRRPPPHTMTGRHRLVIQQTHPGVKSRLTSGRRRRIAAVVSPAPARGGVALNAQRAQARATRKR